MKRYTKEQKRLFHDHIGFAKRMANKFYKKTSGQMALEDAFAHACYGLWQAAFQYDLDQKVKFETYAYKRVMGSMMDALTNESKFVSHQELDVLEQQADYHAKTFEDEYELKDFNRVRMKQVRRALKKLPKRFQLILVKYYIENKNLKQIGKEMNLSKSWMTRLHQRALVELKEAMV